LCVWDVAPGRAFVLFGEGGEGRLGCILQLSTLAIHRRGCPGIAQDAAECAEPQRRSHRAPPRASKGLGRGAAHFCRSRGVQRFPISLHVGCVVQGAGPFRHAHGAGRGQGRRRRGVDGVSSRGDGGLPGRPHAFCLRHHGKSTRPERMRLRVFVCGQGRMTSSTGLSQQRACLLQATS